MKVKKNYTISNEENDKEEWKEIFDEKLLDSALKTFCAFLNCNGGKIIFGIDKHGTNKGLKGNLDEMQTKIYDNIRNHIKPSAHPYFVVEVVDKNIYIFVIPNHNEIYQYKNIIYKRTGSSSHALTFAEAEKLKQQRKNFTKEITSNIYKRTTEGEVLTCSNCGYKEISGMSITLSHGEPIEPKKCPKCDSVLSSNLTL